jgi:hypothetical protein
LRARNLKPGLFKNEILGVRDPLLTILFAGLWCLADRDGRLEDRPLRIKGEVFPYRENLDVNVYLTELVTLGFIERYVIDGLAIIQVLAFADHQHPHPTEKKSTLPINRKTPLDNRENPLSTRELPVTNGLTPSSLNPSSLTPHSLNPHSLNPSLPENGDSDCPDFEDQVREIWKIYPSALRDGVERRAPGNIDEESICDAIARDGYDLVLAGVRNYRDAVDHWEPERKQFIRPPSRFFSEQDYAKDPAIWKEKSNGNGQRFDGRTKAQQSQDFIVGEVNAALQELDSRAARDSSGSEGAGNHTAKAAGER